LCSCLVLARAKLLHPALKDTLLRYFGVHGGLSLLPAVVHQGLRLFLCTIQG
jgi:hypothetical protein